jgi:glycosyltransferase involved in cell wall biosynthesis
LFICNSPQSRDDLCLLDPSRESQAVIIPCALAPPVPAEQPPDLPSVLRDRRSWRALGGAPHGGPANPAADPADPWPFVLAVSTLEPRKNFPGIVRAWERVTRALPTLRLVVVGNPGWNEADALAAMRPHVATGRLLHLEHVPADELRALMRSAICLVFPSFNEGFGYPPLEAMQSGTPSVVADIPVLRWTLGEAALFADPYDVEHVAAQIQMLACGTNRDAIRQALLQRQEAVVSRFRPAAVALQWAALLADLAITQPKHANAT